ncbi:MAG: restriction endonuclease subunit S [Veillonella sp.]|uniref:restriction endonuclease subunit S n=1 Tax=Veillonella sp. TaxID=1926307 RepID=UPI00290B42D5|nr:restriction endonuclease subunit S [Veillonella sp.]MDU5682866.1 restriction endonuclease subunit S [Veillonella sp.]MDU5834597.1 restriction endonuclease subunit S [Veillonella sp.]
MLYKLSDVFDLQMGKTPSRDNNMYWKDGNLPWVSIADLSKSQIYIENSKEMITNLAAKDTLMKCIPQDTVIMSFKLSLGKTAITKTPLYTNEAIMAFIDKKVIQIEPKYIYFLFCNIKWGQYTNNAVKGKTLNKKFFSDFQIYIPEYTQQTKIASLLIRINKILEYKHSLIKAYDAIIKSRFVELFGDPVLNEKEWNLTSLESVCKSIYGGGTPSKKNKEYYMGTIPWVTSKDMKSDIIVDSIEHITQLAIDNSSTRIIPPESVLIVIRSGILKHTLPVCVNKSKVTINQDLKALVLDEHCKAIYLQYLLKALEKDILSGVRAVTADNIEFNSLKKRKIPIPPINIQTQFSQMVNQINKLKSDVQKSIDETQLLMDSLMQEYFG